MVHSRFGIIPNYLCLTKHICAMWKLWLDSGNSEIFSVVPQITYCQATIVTSSNYRRYNHLTLKTTSAQVVTVSVTNNRPTQDFIYKDDQIP